MGRIEASYGTTPPPEEVVLDRYGQMAFEGHRTITSSRMHASGDLVFYVFAPMADYYSQGIVGAADPNPKIVACTIPGDFFTKRVNRFQIWETGNIAIEDNEGTVIASINPEWVAQQLNSIELAETDMRQEGAARLSRLMLSGNPGADRFDLEGIDAVVAYMPITASDSGWSLAVIAPVAESPYYDVKARLTLTGLAYVALSLLAAALASAIIARSVKKQNRL
jgi:hypothetical protein